MTTMMVIEPDLIVRTTISESLRDCGYRVIEAVTADDLWTVLNTRTPVQTVLVNAQLPGTCNGFEVATQLRQTYPGVDVILISGMTDAAAKAAQLCERSQMKTERA
jgi:CheY-like chemotaxis protein